MSSVASDSARQGKRQPRRQQEADSYGGGPLRTAAGYLAMLLVVLVIVVPLFWILSTSLKERGDIYVRPAQWWPQPLEGNNYRDVTTRIPFWYYLRNSLILTIVISAAKIVLGVLSAYASR